MGIGFDYPSGFLLIALFSHPVRALVVVPNLMNDGPDHLIPGLAPGEIDAHLGWLLEVGLVPGPEPNLFESRLVKENQLWVRKIRAGPVVLDHLPKHLVSPFPPLVCQLHQSQSSFPPSVGWRLETIQQRAIIKTTVNQRKKMATPIMMRSISQALD